MSAGSFWSNCLVWAVWKRATKGGYIKARKSHHWIGPHFMWSPDRLVWYGFAPASPKKGWRVLFYMLCFLGKVTRERRAP